MRRIRRPNPYSHGRLPSQTWHNKLILRYFRLIRSGVELLRRLRLPTVASIFGALFTEPVAIFFLMRQTQERRGSPLHHYGLNPIELSSQQMNHPPVVLLAGKRANPAIMTTLARTLSRHPLTRNYPLFTCDWGGRVANQRAQEIVLDRMDQIRTLYPSDRQSTVRCILVGHSMGAIVAAIAGLCGVPLSDEGPSFTDVKQLEVRRGVGRLILIGHPLTAEIDPEEIDPRVLESLYEIDGVHDVLIPGRSRHTNPSHRLSLSCGHIGLTQLKKATQYVAYFVARQQP